METPASGPNPGLKKPIGGFIVVLVAALLIGGWLYVDNVRNELETKVDDLSADLDAARKQAAEKAAQEQAAPAPEEKPQAYAGALAGYRFQVDVPETHRLSIAGEESTSAYIVMKPTPDNETPVPDMAIDLLDVKSQTYLTLKGKDDARSKLVMTADGKAAFWIHVWEDFEWPESAEVIASFKAL